MYSVYIHKNKINQKIYIGITSVPPVQRWNNGKGYYHNRHFDAAIKKYGWNNFEHIILKDNLTKEDAEKMEHNLILQYKSNNSNFGYNLTSGGGIGVTTHSERSKKLMSINSSGNRNPMFGKHHTKETKEKIRQKHLGSKASLEAKINMSKASTQKHQVYCVELNQVFESLKAAADFCNLKSPASIWKVLKGINQTAGGYHWQEINK